MGIRKLHFKHKIVALLSTTLYLEPTLQHIAVCTQATVEAWLTNTSRFCVPRSAADWPPDTVPAPEIRNKTCYW
eukprot:COSAG02_NODE_5297_length_4462_cov_1.634655_4_plen_74_part_00